MKAEIEACIAHIEKTLNIIKDSVDFDQKIQRLAVLSIETENSELWTNQKQAQAILKEQAVLQKTVSDIQQAERTLDDLKTLYALAEEEHDEGVQQDCENQFLQLNTDLEKLRLSTLLSDEADQNNCFLEINSGAGGTEAQDWAAMLARMYSRWAERKGFSTTIIDELPGEEAGFKSISLKISGYQAYG